MAAAVAQFHAGDLPWTATGEEERRFRRITLWVLLTALLLSLAVPYLPVSERPREQAVEVPPRIAKLIIERKPPPPPPPPKLEQPKPEPKPEPKKPQAKPRPVERKVEPAKVQAAREKARSTGVLAFADELADLRENTAVEKLAQSVRSAPGATSAKRTERSVITSGITTGSGGIDTTRLSRDTGGPTRLAGRQTTQVQSPAGTPTTAETRSAKAGRSAGRTPEQIQLVFDRNKSKIDALYRRALRANPLLQGKVVLKLTIAPSGTVTACSIVSSELADADLERKIVQRIKLFNFGAADVDTVTLTYPIEFFPA